jgi:hypothetical protein
VKLADLLESGTRIIEVHPRDARLAEYLSSNGNERYLGLVEPRRLEDVRRDAGTLRSRFQPLDDPSVVVRHDADLLVLPADLAGYLWMAQDLQHLRHVAVQHAGPGTAVQVRMATLAERLGGRVVVKGRYSAAGRSYQVAELPGRRDLRARRYLSPVWGPEGLSRRLEDIGIDSVALRWFESLPALEPGEDLDLLVADEHVEKLHELLAEEPGTIPVDAYSASGLGRADYKGIAYYPPTLARGILDRAIVHESGFRVPCAEDHLHSLAYHVVYHKGDRSGLWSSILDRRNEDPEHDYVSTLARLGEEAAVAVPTDSLEALDEYLANVGWRPPLDTLLRLSVSNPWVGARFFAEDPGDSDLPEPTVFVIRERAESLLTLTEILDVVEHFGFEVLAVRRLDETERARCASDMRGGNWSRGPYPQSGGPPVVAVATVHYGPRSPDVEVRRQYPHLSNTETLLAKRRLRDLVNERLAPEHHCNPVHSSDNEREAWEYIDLTMPRESLELREEVRRMQDDYRTEEVVVAGLSLGRRAKVEVIEHGDGLAVKKTFGRGHRRFLLREVEALRELGPHVAAVPELLATGADWFLCPYYEDQLRSYWGTSRLLPLPVIKEMIATLRAIHHCGFAQIDAKPQNFVLDRERGLKILDFEFLHRYEGPPPDFRESYSLIGVPEGFTGDRPVGAPTYWRRWHRRTGMRLETLLDGPSWRQHAERTAFRLQAFLPRRQAHPRTIGHRLRNAARTARRHLGDDYRAWAAQRAPVVHR